MPDFRYLIGPDLIDIALVEEPVAEPNPTTFEYSTWYTLGDASPVRTGPARVTWRYDGQLLSAAAWDELQSFLNDDGYGLVYIRTRTERMESGIYEYEVFEAIMSRPAGRPIWGERFGEVSVDFLLIENPAKGFDADSNVNVTLFPGTA